MKNIIEYKLDENILTNNYEYFFTFLYDRFEYAVELWCNELEKKFNKKFKPIWVLPSKQSHHFKKNNYIIINKKLKNLISVKNNPNIVHQTDYDDLNIEFAESEFVQETIRNLIKKQSIVYILPFTSCHLNFNNNSVKLLAPDPEASLCFDDKTTHINIFENLQIPTVKAKVYKKFEEINSAKKYPFYLTATYSAGGYGSAIISNKKDLKTFYLKLREINKNRSFLIADIIPDIKYSPNVSAMVCGKNDTRIICITDQILRDNEYIGNIYPSKIMDSERTSIIESAKKVGDHLSNSGYKGLFGLDFLIDSDGKIYCIDLNPRRQGGYLCNILMSSKINIPKIELKLFLDEQIPNFDSKDFIEDYSWAHGKIKPYQPNMFIKNSFNEGLPSEPFKNIGSSYKVIFYNEGNLLVNGSVGYFIISGKNYKEVEKVFIKEIEKLICNNLSSNNISETHP